MDSLENLEQAMSMIGWPAILKSRTLGYDGKGQSLLKSADDLKSAWELLAGVPAIVEAFVPFNREVSIIAARKVSGAIAFYPLSENFHRGGILRVSECCDNDPMQQQAESYISRLMEELDYVGVLASTSDGFTMHLPNAGDRTSSLLTKSAIVRASFMLRMHDTPAPTD